MKQRQDYGNNADTFFDALNRPIAALARELRKIIRKAIPEATESMKWGMPVYEQNGVICSIRISAEFVALQFYKSGTGLRDPDGLLEGTGKRMRHIKIRSKTDIKSRLFISWIRTSLDPA